jgi:sporulation protein YlmC with PRC-barrel domain
MSNEGMDRVVPLNQLDDFRVSDGDPDVRGWDVLSADGKRIGEVDELLVDTDAMKVRYLDVDVESTLLAGEAGRHVLIPIGYARLERDGNRVIVEAMEAAALATLPAYGHTPLTRDFEQSVRDSFAGGRRTPLEGGRPGAPQTPYTGASQSREGGTGQDFYAHHAFDEDRFYGNEREGRAGDTGIRNEEGISGSSARPSQQTGGAGSRGMQGGAGGQGSSLRDENIGTGAGRVSDTANSAINRGMKASGVGGSSQRDIDTLREDVGGGSSRSGQVQGGAGGHGLQGSGVGGPSQRDIDVSRQGVSGGSTARPSQQTGDVGGRGMQGGGAGIAQPPDTGTGREGSGSSGTGSRGDISGSNPRDDRSGNR